MDDDEDWQLTAEQLDALERDAKTQIAHRHRSPSSSSSLPSSSFVPNYSHSSPSSMLARASAPDAIPTAPFRNCSFSTVVRAPWQPESPQKVAPGNVNLLQRSPAKRSFSVAHGAPAAQAASPLRSVNSPGKVFASMGGKMGSPGKSSDKGAPFRVFLDHPGKIAAETLYNQQLVAAFKTISGHEWDPKRRLWLFPERHFEDALQAIASCLPAHMEIDVVPPLLIPPKFREICKRSASNITSPSDSSKSKSYEPSASQGEDNIGQDVASLFDPKPSLFFVVQVFLMDDDYIAVRSPYHENVKKACQSVSGRLWNAMEKVWMFPRNTLEELVQALTTISSPEIKLEAVPPLVISPQTFREPSVESCPYTIADSQDHRTNTSILSQESPLNVSENQDSDITTKKYLVKLMLHASGRIAAKFEYHPPLVAAMRSIPGAEWWPKERLWTFPLSCLPELEKAPSGMPNVQVDHFEPLVQRALREFNKFPNLEGRYDSIPEDLEKQLLPFQRTGVRFALLHGGRALIADEMGLGKTLQALAIATCFQEDWPVLVIVPSSLRLHWAIMIKKWLNIRSIDITVLMPQGCGSNRDGFNVALSSGRIPLKLDGLFNIVSYDSVPKLHHDFSDMNFKVVIADESHYMKNGQAKRTIASIPLIQKAKYSILLTGTPALSRPMELFTQLQALQPSVYRNVHEYGRRYCLGGAFGMYQGASNHEELHALIKSTIMIRRLKKEVLSQLPQKRRQQVFLSLDKEGVKLMRSLFLELEDVKRRNANCMDAEATEKLKYAEKQLISKLYVESSKVKLPAVQEYLTTVLEADCKFLVFAHHQEMLDGIQSLFTKKKVKYIRIDGATPASSRQTLATKFQDDQNVQVALLGIRAAGVGITLTAASTVIFAELSWTPGDLVQAEDRAHRIGQESAVNVYYMHAHDTIDDLIWDSVQHKLENLGQVLDGKEDQLKASAAPMQSQTAPLRQRTLDTFISEIKEGDNPVESISALEGEVDTDRQQFWPVQSRRNVRRSLTHGYQPEANGENISSKRSKVG